jgi:arsenite methyltransferase
VGYIRSSVCNSFDLIKVRPYLSVFLSANIVKDFERVIGIDMTEEMLEKARINASKAGYTNVEFKKGDIEKGIP